MSENAKTITFVIIGLLAVVIGLVTQPRSAEVDDVTLVGRTLTEKFTNPDEAKRLRIIRFDEETASLSNFEVAEQDGLWTIPSKSGYPADAAEQMAQAATSLMDRKILGVATKSAGDHEEYGVIDPMSPKLEEGEKGVGTRVTMSDTRNEPLVDLIVGKAVKGADDQRYVREAGRDIVYIIEIDSSKLSTDFEDWIEKDLLKLNSWDLQQVEIKDYSAELVQGMTPDGQFGIGIEQDRRAEMIFAYNETDAKWNAVKLQQFEVKEGENGKYVDFKLAEDEELNDTTLNALKTALDDLKIVDVARKPSGLSQDLKAGADFLNSRETLLDLMMKGFTAAPGEGGGPGELISSDGEVIATMNDGTEYVLRFGNLTSAGTSGDAEGQEGEAATATATKTEQKPASGSDVNRYLFVMARFNESAVKEPELEKLPELPAGASEATEEKSGEAASAASDSAEATAAAGNEDKAAAANSESSESTDDRADSSESPATATPAAETSSAEGNGDTPASEDADSEEAGASEGEAEPDGDNQSEPPSADASASTENEAADKPADAPTPTGSQESADNKEATAAAGDEKAKEVETIIAERKRLEQENQRKLDEYQEKLKTGRENVKELNLRFGDWYFVVPDDVFKKVRLGRKDIIKKKEKKEQATTPGTGESGPDGEAAAGDTPVDAGAIPGLPPIPNTDESESE